MMTLSILLICLVLGALALWVHPYIGFVLVLVLFIGIPAAIMTDLTTAGCDENYYDGVTCE